jgi:DNA-binding beta-propeller fold protein YncE
MKVVDTFSVGSDPQHVVPSWDLKTLWVTNNSESNHAAGSLTPIDPLTGKPGAPITVDDPYNLYFSPDGKSAIVVAEGLKRLDFRDPKTMALQSSIATPNCSGVNHADFSLDGSYVIFTCEFQGNLVKIDMVNHSVMGYLQLSANGMPQDIRVGPNGRTFYVADMAANGVYIIDGDTFTKTGFVATGPGAHGVYPSRDAKFMYIANRGYSSLDARKANGPGSVSLINVTTNTVTANWPIPGGGSPDMGNVSADGSQLWLSGRADDVVYAFDTKTGAVTKIAVGKEPHGLAVWPQPGRYSLGHTGIMR